MKIRYPVITALVYGFVAVAWGPTPAYGQPPPKAIVLAWDGAVPAFVHDMLRQKKLPNLAKLIAGGALADGVTPVFPSTTAPGFASLMTGAPPSITGISGSRVPRTPLSQFTILDSSAGFATTLLRAEPLWAAAERAGRKVAVAHMPFGGETSETGLRLQGYAAIAGREGIITGRTAEPQAATSWDNLPQSAAPPLEIAFTIGASTFFGLLIDDPSDPQDGYDTLLIAGSRNGENVKARLKSAPAGPGGALFWSQPMDIKASDGRDARTYLRMFDLKRDGSDFFLYYTRPARDATSPAELLQDANATARAFIGNGASQLYSQGALGATIPHGGSGAAEARYLETVVLVEHQLMETHRWALEHFAWGLFFAYTPYPDEAEHLWRGFLDPSLPGFRPEIAERLRPFLERVYETADELLGSLMASRPENTILALISDHGMEGADKLVAINKALQQGGLLALDNRGRVDLARTRAFYPALNNGYLLINSTDRKGGIVTAEERAAVARRARDLLLAIRDGGRQPVRAVYDAEIDGAALGIGGESGGDLYLDLLPGYDLDARLGTGDLITRREPHGTHGFNPQRASMRTLMVLNGPGIQAGRRLSDVRIIDFAPTLAKLLGFPPPRDAKGKVIEEAFTDSH